MSDEASPRVPFTPIDPVAKMLVIEPWCPPETVGGLYMPEQGRDEGVMNQMHAETTTHMGTIVATGPEVTKAKLGDEIWFRRGVIVLIDGGHTTKPKQKVLTSEDDILAFIHRQPEAPSAEAEPHRIIAHGVGE